MKIVIMAQRMGIGGVQRLILDEARELSRRGHLVTVVTFEAEVSGETLLPEVKKIASTVFIPYPRMRDFGGFFSLLRFLKKEQPDVICTHMWFANTVGRLTAFFFNTPIVAFEHSTYETVKPKRQLALDRFLQGLSFRVVAVSEAVRQSLIRNGIKSNRITVIENGIVLPSFNPLSKEPDYFLFIGRLIHDKGVDILLEALARVPGAQVTIVGDGPERIRLETQAEHLGIVDRVTFHGMASNVVPFLGKALALVIPSRREGFGIVALEARAAGVPVIATSVGGLPSVVEDGVNGIIVLPDNAENLADAMRRLIDDSHERDRLSKHTQEDLKRFSISRHVDELLELLSDAVGCVHV